MAINTNLGQDKGLGYNDFVEKYKDCIINGIELNEGFVLIRFNDNDKIERFCTTTTTLLLSACDFVLSNHYANIRSLQPK